MRVLVHGAAAGSYRVVAEDGPRCGMWQVRGDAKHAMGQHVQCRDGPDMREYVHAKRTESDNAIQSGRREMAWSMEDDVVSVRTADLGAERVLRESDA